MIDGSMQDYPLTLNRFLDHAARWHGEAEVASARENGSVARISYAMLRERSLAISSLLTGFGIAQGDRVATLAWNSAAHVELWYAVMGMGAVCHTLNPRLTGPQLASMAVQSGAKILVASADLLPLAKLVAERAPGIERILLIDGAGGSGASVPVAELESLIADAPGGAVWGDFAETAPAGLCFTSGTTGAPKGVTYTHRGSFLHTLRSLQADVMAFTSRDAVLAVVPMFHANAWGLPFALPAVGGKLVLPGRQADGASLARLIAAEGVTIGVGVPTVWLGLVEHLEAVGGALPTLERLIVGGAPMAPALMERLEARLGVTVQTSWGMTELSPLGVIAPPGDPQRSAAVSGRPAIGVDLRLTDAGGAPLAEQRGGEGHLYVRGASVVDRYFGEEAPATDAEGWFPTGDLARIDAKGNLIVTGRAKDLIKSGGEWINPAEIEAVVGALPQVSLAAVIGRQDAKWGERPVLLVEMRGGDEIDDAELLAPLSGRVAPWWIPDAVVRLDTMPLAPTGKIDKIRLRNDYGAY
ncbi:MULTISPECIES: AMP-binding protein [unclassified Sphingopyxis]|uniref:AMP-binding protein n=1 Tax=unclassified Sphingopyxis TaxID=2614943 RepID=UPI0007363015|nr:MULTISPECIES: AMP-binding protein [unclassified Sphingopyxis]KTE41102.1 AMP-dependent synthetase [Sphingopyxis sp. HIX]KTE84262.1 AMP-dependent synthetase [Sphingopyxis sp. HXXIV]